MACGTSLEANAKRKMSQHTHILADGADIVHNRRFIREFDVSDRDPSKTAARLSSFEDTLRKLFVDGYIMIPAGGSSSSGEPPAAPQEA